MKYVLKNLSKKTETEYFNKKEIDEVLYKERKNKSTDKYELVTYIPDYKKGTITKITIKITL